MITILIVDDQSFVCKGIRRLLESREDLEVVATASDGMEAVAKARLHQPDIAIIDVSMPLMNGIETTRQIRASCPTTRVLNLSLYDHPVYVKNALQAGASGYILKEGFANELLEAIQSVYNGGSYFSRKIARFVEPPFVEDNE